MPEQPLSSVHPFPLCGTHILEGEVVVSPFVGTQVSPLRNGAVRISNPELHFIINSPVVIFFDLEKREMEERPNLYSTFDKLWLNVTPRDPLRLPCLAEGHIPFQRGKVLTLADTTVLSLQSNSSLQE